MSLVLDSIIPIVSTTLPIWIGTLCPSQNIYSFLIGAKPFRITISLILFVMNHLLISDWCKNLWKNHFTSFLVILAHNFTHTLSLYTHIFFSLILGIFRTSSTFILINMHHSVNLRWPTHHPVNLDYRKSKNTQGTMVVCI